MPTNMLATVTMEHTSGIAKDRVVNTFAMKGNVLDTVAAQGGRIAACLTSFYNDVQSSGSTLASYLSHGISRAAGGATVRVYNLDGHEDGTPHGSPIYQSNFTMAAVAGATSPQPEEVACVLTLRANQWAEQPIERPDGVDLDGDIDRPRQRYSGRVFIGPLNNGTNTPVANISRPNTTFKTTLLDAGEGLYDDLAAAGTIINWCVWSRQDHVLRPITDVQVDDAFDTQRRRGATPTLRTNRVVFP